MALFKSKNSKSVELLIFGKKVSCPICENDLYDKRRVQLNTAMMTFLNLDWANKSAYCYTCTECKHILWFED